MTTRQSKPENPAPIRPYQDADRDAVAALWQACNLVVPYNHPADDIAFCVDAPNAALFVAEDGPGAVVATTMAGHDGHRGWLYFVAVDPTWRDKGLGRDIVAHAEAWLTECGVRKVNLIIRETNLAVQTFYEHLGYKVEPRAILSRWLIDDPYKPNNP